jgi:RNase P subunit RPR2
MAGKPILNRLMLVRVEPPEPIYKLALGLLPELGLEKSLILFSLPPYQEDKMKQALCRKCKVVLSLENSAPCVIKKGSGHCRNCRKEVKRFEYNRHSQKYKDRNKINYDCNPEKYRELSRANAISSRGHFTALRRELRRENVFESDLLWSYNFYFYFMIDAVCHYCLGPLNSYGHGLDRIDNTKNHEANNVVPCCKRCNSIKGWFWEYGDMVLVAPRLQRFRQEKDYGSSNNDSGRCS